MFFIQRHHRIRKLSKHIAELEAKAKKAKLTSKEEKILVIRRMELAELRLAVTPVSDPVDVPRNQTGVVRFVRCVCVCLLGSLSTWNGSFRVQSITK